MKDEKRVRRSRISWFLCSDGCFCMALVLPASGADKFPSSPVKMVITHAAGRPMTSRLEPSSPFCRNIWGPPSSLKTWPAQEEGNRGSLSSKKNRMDTLFSPPACLPVRSARSFLKVGINTLSFTHIFSMFSDSTGLLVKSDSPYKDMADFVEKAKGKTLSCAVPGVGSTAHLNGMILTRYLGLTTKWVPYDGGTEALTALAGGHVDYVICDTGSATAMLNAKSARLLMIFDDKRDPRYPDIPIQKDLGYNVDTIPSLRGMVGPPGRPCGCGEDTGVGLWKSGPG